MKKEYFEFSKEVLHISTWHWIILFLTFAFLVSIVTI